MSVQVIVDMRFITLQKNKKIFNHIFFFILNNISEIAADEFDATIITDFVYEEKNDSVERKPWKFCNNLTVPRSEVVVMSQMILILFLLTFCIYKLSLTKLSCEETSVWFSILSGLIGYVLPNPRI